jgi:thioredoxin reductase
VVVGAELVSWSAVMTLRDAGCARVLMTTTYPSPESYAAFNIAGRALFGVPVATRTRTTRVIGHGRVTGVEIEDTDSGDQRVIDCDTVVFTGDWIPDHELARGAGIGLDAATKGPLVDTALRTIQPGVFAAGNVLHAVGHRQNGRVISTKRLPWPASPGRVFRIPASMLTGVDATGGRRHDRHHR